MLIMKGHRPSKRPAQRSVSDCHMPLVDDGKMQSHTKQVSGRMWSNLPEVSERMMMRLPALSSQSCSTSPSRESQPG